MSSSSNDSSSESGSAEETQPPAPPPGTDNSAEEEVEEASPVAAFAAAGHSSSASSSPGGGAARTTTEEEEGENASASEEKDEHHSGAKAIAAKEEDKNKKDRHFDELFQRESSDDSDVEQRIKKPELAVPSHQSDDGGMYPGSDSDGPLNDESKENRKADSQEFQAAKEDLFGDAGDLSSSDDEKKKSDNDDFNEDDIVGPRMYIEDDEEEQGRQPPAETVINVEAPRINANLGNQIHFVKFPNFLSVEPRVFDQDTYEDEIDEDEVLDEEGRSRLKLKVENMIRWRNGFDDEGNPSKESNAKIVRWSDGTMSLYLGAEIFDVHLHDVHFDHNHLFVRQGQGLQGQAVFRTKLTFRPHSTDTLTHRKMTLSMADRSSKAQKVKVLAEVGTDPETQKQELVRKEEERLRASARRESQQRRIRERNMNRGLSAGFLEPDRDEDSDEGESLAAIKRSYKPGGKEFDKTVRGLRGSESDDSGHGRTRLEGAKRLESDEDEKEDSPTEHLTKKRKVIEESDEDL